MIIEAKENKLTSTGKPMTVFTLSGKKYNTFDASYDKFNVGDHVKVTFKQNGKYTNIETMSEGSAEETQNEAPAPSQIVSTPSVAAVSTVMNFSDKPHSYEFGKAGNRHKVYYNTVEELQEHVELLKAADLYLESNSEIKPEDFGKE